MARFVLLLAALLSSASAFLAPSFGTRVPTSLAGRGDRRTTKGKRFLGSNGKLHARFDGHMKIQRGSVGGRRSDY